jgi:acetyl esterase/lipase
MAAEDILSKPQPPFDQRVSYGPDANQFIEVRIPAQSKKKHPALLNIHGGFWRAKYNLEHAGHLCEALRIAGFATFNIEYRRVGNPGGGWPGTFDDIRSAYRFVLQSAERFSVDANHVAVMGHSAGGQLALCLAGHEASLQRAISLAGAIDLKKCFDLHLSNDAVAEFLGGKPEQVPDHYHEADPAELKINHAKQWILHGDVDDTVPVSISRDYVAAKKKKGEAVEWFDIAGCGHFELIDPGSEPFKKQVITAVSSALS